MESTSKGTFARSLSERRHVKRAGFLKRAASFSVVSLVLPVLLATAGNVPAAIADPACANLSLINGGFEVELPDPKPNDNFWWGDYLDASHTQDFTDGWDNLWRHVQGIGWLTTQPNSLIEFWAGDPALTDDQDPVAFDGHTFAELNAWDVGALYQDVSTTPGTAIVWSLAHRGRNGIDVMAVKIGAPADLPVAGSLGASTAAFQQGPNLSDGIASWGVHTGIYVVPSGQSITRFWFESVTSVGGDSQGNFLDGVTFTPYNCSSETPTYSPPSATADGFTFQLTNYDPAGMTASSTLGSATISSTGLVTLTGIPANTHASVTITNHHEGFIDASVVVDANSLGSALIPKFDTPTETSDGFTAQITNYDPAFNWAVSTTDSSSATVNGSGLVTVIGSNINTVVPVTTTKAFHRSGNAFVKTTSVRLPAVVYVPVVVPPSNSYYEPAPVQLVPKPVAEVRKPVTISIGGFRDGSSILTTEIKNKIRKFLTKYNDYKVISITGFTEGPSVLKGDRALSRMRAVNALDYIRQASKAKFDKSNIRSNQEKILGSKIRRIQITLEDLQN